jgi:hypothetical protein
MNGSNIIGFPKVLLFVPSDELKEENPTKYSDITEQRKIVMNCIKTRFLNQ